MKLKLPKYVQRAKNGKYQVCIRSKKYGTKKYVGIYTNLNDAISARDKFVVENYNDFTEGYLPRGITRMGIKFYASFTFKDKDEFLGSFSNLSDAVQARNNFINSLK